MSYKLEFSKEAHKALKKMDKHQSALITRWLYMNIDGIDDPHSRGKALTSNLSGYWRYRIGDFRVICEIHEDRLVVLVVSIGHRRDIYKG
ncbi:hypothetical protein YK48G_17230 [Lentilactobacillus fungorum]|uniref:Type II toxin-antitoxin system RelE/ParE family toxin n=1 Tax=Lentilactobacillus fungorum TaxID=2201250 RepID=A0ABQ3VZG8_9LACO|nr:type II toxin-antitoxin system RelE/ParE family toxin [Lentilactobacillus fungorum]GHP14298.1 hypothetical protein YK48G_17230 [Lentilactobacillus fungorum]